MGSRSLAVASFSFVALLLSSATGESQTPETEMEAGWTSVSFAGGFSTGSSDTGVALGGTFIYELSPRLAIEASAHYLDRGRGADAFDLSASALVSLVPSRRHVVPYVAAGGGLYRASYHLDHQRFFGSTFGRFGPGPFFNPSGMMIDFDESPFDDFFGEMPRFYMNRFGDIVLDGDGRVGARSFTDPALSFGGGVRLDVGPHVFLRPDARALVAFANRDTYTVGVFTINVGYRF